MLDLYGVKGLAHKKNGNTTQKSWNTTQKKKLIAPVSNNPLFSLKWN